MSQANERSTPRLPGGFSLPPFGVHQWLALAIVCVALWALGLLWLGMQAGSQWMGTWQHDLRFHAYMEGGNQTKLKHLADQLALLPGVSSARVVPHQEMASWLHDWLGSGAVDEDELLRSLPGTVEITPGSETGEFLYSDIADEVRRLGATLNSGEMHLVQVQRWLANIERLLWFVTLILVLAMAIIISNTLRMILLARADEVQLMRLLGANEWFVRMPFILEGMLLGSGAGVLAWFLLWPLILGAASWFAALDVSLNGFILLAPMVFGGGMAGGLGAWVATMRLPNESTATT
ncbi:MAG: hypothetical protein BMS9Abin18_0300 [Zetaproteobacteria bacterium]|nr:MAG: hypothetical protein BMS9Abin18_0300 [Zetaproteobacteria bacterium]